MRTIQKRLTDCLEEKSISQIYTINTGKKIVHFGLLSFTRRSTFEFAAAIRTERGVLGVYIICVECVWTKRSNRCVYLGYVYYSFSHVRRRGKTIFIDFCAGAPFHQKPFAKNIPNKLDAYYSAHAIVPLTLWAVLEQKITSFQVWTLKDRWTPVCQFYAIGQMKQEK